MRELPAFVQEKMQPRLKVIWWGRRAFLECVAEISNGVFWSYITIGLVWNVAIWTDLDTKGTFWLAALGFVLMASRRAVFEFAAWYYEIYVVARDEVNGGGRLYKFFGWLNRRYIDETITIQSPSILPEQPWYWRLWGWITDEHMMKVKLASVNHVFIEGKKISPKFENAIKFIRGYKPSKEEAQPGHLSHLSDLKQARIDGLITQEQARQAATVLLGRIIYGD